MSFKNEYFLLRHSDTDRSKDVHFSEHELSEVGKSQSQEIVLILENLNIGLVYSSPYKRALQTVGPFLNKLELEVNIDDRLSGRKVGDISKEEVWTFFEDSWNDFEFTKQGAESASECRGRISSLIESLESEHIGKKILLVSHSNPIAFYLSTLDKSINFKWFSMMKSPSLFNVGSQGNENTWEEIELPK